MKQWRVIGFVILAIALASCGESPQPDSTIGPSGRSEATSPNEQRESDNVERSPTPIDAAATRAGSFTTIELGVDWCSTAEVLTDRSTWTRPVVLNQSRTAVLTVDPTDTQWTDIQTGEITETIPTENLNPAQTSGWFWSWPDDRSRLLTWNEETGVQYLEWQPTNSREQIRGQLQFSDDGTLMALEAFPDGPPPDFGDIVRESTQIYELASSEHIATLEGSQVKLFPNGVMIAVPDVVDWTTLGWSIRDLNTMEEVATIDAEWIRFSQDRQWLFASREDFDNQGKSTASTIVYRIDDFLTPVATLHGHLVQVSPDGRFAVTTNGLFPVDDENNPMEQELTVRSVQTGEPVLEVLEKPFPVGPRSYQELLPPMNGLTAFSSDSTVLATWTQSDAGIGVHVFDLELGALVDVIPANSGAYVQFDSQDDTLYLSDRSTGQFAHVDLTNGAVLVGQSNFSHLDYTSWVATDDQLLYLSADGRVIRCELRTFEEGAGDEPKPPPRSAGDSQPVTEDIALNALIPAGYCQQENAGPVQLVDGLIEQEFDGWTEKTWIERTTSDDLYVGDLTGEGTADAIFVLTCNFGGNFNSKSLMLWIAGQALYEPDLSSATSPLGYEYSSYSSVVRGLEVSGSVVRVEWFAALPGDPSCCPSVHMISTYRVSQLGELRFLRNEAQNEESEKFEEVPEL